MTTWSLCISCVLLVLLACVVQCMRATSIMELRVFRRLQCRVPAVCMPNTTIPKVIYRTAKSKTLSPAHQEAWDLTAKHNPEFQQVLIDDDDADAFMRTAMNGYAYEAYRSLVPGAAKADLLRYVLMYVKGGVYLDIKSGARELCRLIRPGDQMLVSTWSTTTGSASVLGGVTITSMISNTALGQRVWSTSIGELQQWWLVCCPGHPVMRRVVQAVVEQITMRLSQNRVQKEPLVDAPLLKDATCCYFDVLRTTGPYIFTRTVLDALDAHLHTDEAEDHRIRQVCGNGNDIMIYDVSGTHSSASSYNQPGELLRVPSAPSSSS